jgi:tyrosyl-tRNA synthetase
MAYRLGCDVLGFLRGVRVGRDDDTGAVPRRLLWGVAATGEPHLGYLQYLVVARGLAEYGCDALVLVSTHHAGLDSGKAAWDDTADRGRRYHRVFVKLTHGMRLLRTEEFYATTSYQARLMRFAGHLGVEETIAAGRTTLGNTDRRQATAADVLYVACQAIDVEHLDADAVLCGRDEQPIYDLALDRLRQVTGHRTTCFSLPMLPGLRHDEMHATQPDQDKILLVDTADEIESKLARYWRTTVDGGQLGAHLAQLLLPLIGHADLARFALMGREAREIAKAIRQATDALALPLRPTAADGGATVQV